MKALSSPDSKPDDFNRPGHIFPLKYREGGVLKRAGHTEASVDLAMLAGLPPAAVLCEIVDDDDGSMARLPKLREFAKRENLKIISIADLVRYGTYEILGCTIISKIILLQMGLPLLGYLGVDIFLSCFDASFFGKNN